MEDYNKNLIINAESGNLVEVELALQHGADPNSMGPNSGGLHVAAFNGHEKIVNTLIKAGANVNARDKQSYTPLLLASSKGYTKICMMLIKAGADIEQATDKGGTALHVSAASDFVKVIKLLLKEGANIEALDNFSNTPLITASSQGNDKCVKLLLKEGANINAKNKGQDTSILLALKHLYAVRKSNWKSQGNRGNVNRIVRYTLEKGAFRYLSCDVEYYSEADLGDIMSIKDQKYCASQSWGPSHHLPYLECFETIKILINEGADLHSINSVGQSAMWLACAAGEARIIKKLHQAKADFKAIEANGKFIGATCLHKVSASGRLDGLKMYLKLHKNHDIHEVDHYGYSCLHYLADMGGHVKMAEVLIEHGANKDLLTTKDRSKEAPAGTSARDVALHWKDNVIADILK